MATGLTIPNLQPRRDPWAEFLQAFMYGQQIRREREQEQLRFQSEQEDRKLRQQGLKLQLDALKLEGSQREKQFTQQGEMGKLDVFKLMSGMPGQQFGLPALQQEVPGMATDLQGGMAPSTFEPMPGAMPQSLELPHPPMEIFGQQVRPPNLTQVLQQTLAQNRMKGFAEAEAAGLKTTAEERARAPFNQIAVPGFEQPVNKAIAPSLITERGANQRATAQNRTTLDAARIAADAQRENTRFTRTQQLAGDYQQQVGNFTRVQGALGNAEELFAEQQRLIAAGQTPNPQLDETLLFQYLQARESVPNVVREGERTMWNDTLGLGDKAKTALTRARGRGLPPDIRQQLMDTMRVIGRNTQKYRGKVDADFRQKANRWGVDPADVLSGLSVNGPVNPQAPAFVKYQGQTVPFAQLPPEVQQQVLALQGR